MAGIVKRRLPIEDPRFARLRLALCRHHPPYVNLDEVALRVYDTLGRLPSKPTNEKGPSRRDAAGTGCPAGTAGKESLP